MPASSPAVPTEPDAPGPSPHSRSDDDVPAMGPRGLPADASRTTNRDRHASGGWSCPVVIAVLIAGALVVTLIATATWRGEPVPADAPSRSRLNAEAIAAEPPPPVPQHPARRADRQSDDARYVKAATQTPALPPPAAEPADQDGTVEAAGCGRGATLRDAFNRRRLEMRSARPSRQPGRALLLLAAQVTDRHHGPTPVVPRGPLAPVSGAPHSRQHDRRLPHLSVARPSTVRLRPTGGSNSGRATGSCCTKSASSSGKLISKERREHLERA